MCFIDKAFLIQPQSRSNMCSQPSGNPQCVEICRWSHTQVLRSRIWNPHPLNYKCSFNLTWQPCGNRFKRNPVSSFACPCGKLLFLLKAANEADSRGVSGSVLARGSAHAAAAQQSTGGPGSHPWCRRVKALWMGPVTSTQRRLWSEPPGTTLR